VADSVTSPRFPPLLLRALLVVGTTLAYANTFSVPFVFDDIAAITQNPSLASFASALFPPDALSVTGRPLANLSLALNHALSRESVWSYHALNLALHLTNTLLLFALIRRTLSGGRSLLAGDCVAFTAASLWSLHPLHTASFTYVMQRTELLAACATLLALYAFTRSGVRWLTVSVVACAAGMTAKETAVVIPLLILAYDRTWGSRSYAAALRARPAFYAALAGTWLILAALLLGTASRGASAGFSTAISATDYALTQVYAVPHYLRLAVWPAPLVFDYGTFLTRSLVHVLPGALVLIALLAATVIALRRRPAVSFCGLCFFALLAPASSVIPIATQTIAEHRVYLALAAPIALLAFILHARFAHRASLFLITLSLGLGVATFARNTTYRSVLSLWQDTAAKAPANPRAHYNLALAQLDAGQRPAALVSLATATRLDPTHALAHHKLGTALVADARFADALPHLTASAQLTPDSAAAHYELANLLVRLARVADAAPHYTTAVRLAPAHAAARYNFGNALTQLGRYADALVQFDEAARLDQADTSARTNAARIRDYLRATPP
jgi:tetratricopeptide (TPR) repeat protein